MENREQQILSEIRKTADSLRKQLEYLESKVDELYQRLDPEYLDEISIELDILDEGPAAAVVKEIPMVIVPEAVADVQEEHPADDDDLPADDDIPAAVLSAEDDLPADDVEVPGVFEQPVPEVVKPAAERKLPVIDAMAGKQAWRSDMPGSPVNDVRSAIALNDRLLFINYLFDEDPLAFQNAIQKVNTMTTLDQVVEYVTSTYPQWDLDSEIVYRFMMAVRRRVK